MKRTTADLHVSDLRSLLWAQNRQFLSVVVFSTFVNILVLTGPIFALQIYDRVLGSRSVETLAALTILMSFLFIVMGILDFVRKRITARIGEILVSQLEERIFNHVATQISAPQNQRTRILNDLDSFRQFFASPVFVALFDLPWIPVFFVGIALFHPALGWFTLIGATLFVLPGLTALFIRGTGQLGDAHEFQQAQTLSQRLIADPEMVLNSPLKSSIFRRWTGMRTNARTRALMVQDKRVGLAALAQTFRLFLQSALIALGAYLVIHDQLSAGAIIASTVLLGRALGPLDLVSQNAGMLRGQIGVWKRIAKYSNSPALPSHTKTPFSLGTGLLAEQITVFPPQTKRAALRMISFDVPPAQALGVVGPTGAGKSTLIKAIAGLWPVAGGRVALGSAQTNGIDPDTRTRRVGYLSQQLRLLDGTIGENIAGHQFDISSEQIVDAATLAGAHDLILNLPNGYDTWIDAFASNLAAGLRQRVGLARAIFNQPDLLLLDEPTNNLDASGIQALNNVVTTTLKRGACVVICSQRPLAVSGCQNILVLNDGKQSEFGPSELVLKKLLPRSLEIVPTVRVGEK